MFYLKKLEDSDFIRSIWMLHLISIKRHTLFLFFNQSYAVPTFKDPIILIKEIEKDIS